MAATFRILLDLTPLDTPSGPRGIGRYIRELALGLSELPREELIDHARHPRLQKGPRSIAPTESDFCVAWWSAKAMLDV